MKKNGRDFEIYIVTKSMWMVDVHNVNLKYLLCAIRFKHFDELVNVF